MASLIHELENNEALLLMYLADELPEEDQAEVREMLARDAGLRGELDEISGLYDGAMHAMARLDANSEAVAGENHAVRQASRAMRQWHVDRLTRQPVAAPAVKARVPTWAYPAGVAAMLLIGSLIWWGGESDVPAKVASSNPSAGWPADGGYPGPLGPGIVPPGVPGGAANPAVPARPATTEEIARASLLEKSFTSETQVGLSEAEMQATSLAARSDDGAVASDIFLRDGNQ
jgi:hypothetical protein